MKKVLVLLFFGLGLFAHPHFFIDASIDIQKKRIIHTWKFDSLNSRLLAFDFDKDRDKKFSKEEQEAFLNAHFYKLKSDNYNIFLESAESEVEIVPLKPQVLLKQKRVVLMFEQKIELKGVSTLCTIDPTLYFAYKLIDAKSGFTLEIQKSEHDYCIGVIQ